ncbi:MAG: AAA family ATPase, partial [Ruminococcus sp.]|nr:AAA family ATPase [Ruminococcus sp.]
MGIYLNQGNELMYNSVNYSKIYVDKSMLIDAVNSCLYGNDRFLCVSRPRRFGKSMAANMLVAYYSKGADSRELFSKLAISKSESFEKYLNKFNVIHADMQKFLVRTKNVTEMLDFFEEDILTDIQEDFPDVKMPSHLDISRAVNAVFQKTKVPFVFIIDEWDCVLREYSNDLEEQKIYLDYLYVLFKDQPYVALAYMTGILPIKKYGKHSALNMFAEYSMENQRELAEFTGFTENEVTDLCKKYDMNISETKKWYNGYNLKGLSIYNPRSVVMSM